MGILYNRFTEQSQQTLIPYSNQSNIYTYLVPSSFKGSSSTVWGDDYPVPMIYTPSQFGTGWAYSSDGSVYLQGSFTMDLRGTSIEYPTKYTVYMVVRYNRLSGSVNPLFCLVKDTSSLDKIYELNGVQVKASLAGTGSTYTSNLTPAGSAEDYYHVYAYRRCVGKFCHVVDGQSLVTISAPQFYNAGTYNFYFRNIDHANLFENSANLKFLAIVNGEESDSTILNNVSNIRTRLNLP